MLRGLSADSYVVCTALAPTDITMSLADTRGREGQLEMACKASVNNRTS